jgi:hypothetical protein
MLSFRKQHKRVRFRTQQALYHSRKGLVKQQNAQVLAQRGAETLPYRWDAKLSAACATNDVVQVARIIQRLPDENATKTG